MNPLPARQHFHKMRNAPGAGFGQFCVVHPIDDGVAIGPIQYIKEACRRLVRRKRGCQIVRYLRFALREVRSVPSTVTFCRVYFSQAGRFDAALLCKLLCSGAKSPSRIAARWTSALRVPERL